jgi:hypothetical protein
MFPPEETSTYWKNLELHYHLAPVNQPHLLSQMLFSLTSAVLEFLPKTTAFPASKAFIMLFLQCCPFLSSVFPS